MAAAFLAIAVTFVYRSFFNMRIGKSLDDVKASLRHDESVQLTTEHQAALTSGAAPRLPRLRARHHSRRQAGRR